MEIEIFRRGSRTHKRAEREIKSSSCLTL